MKSRKNPNRTAVSNGTRLLPGQVDGRSRFARRYRDLIQDMGADLGGYDGLTTLQVQLIRRAAALASRCEMAEADLAAGRAIDSERFASDVGLLTRIARQLGLARVARDVTRKSDLQSYLASRSEMTPSIIEHEPADPQVAASDRDPGNGAITSGTGSAPPNRTGTAGG